MDRRLAKRKWILGLVAATVFLTVAWPVSAGAQYSQCLYKLYHWENTTWVRYQQGDPFPSTGGNLWKYEYTVYNDGLLFVNLFRIFFNSDNINHAEYVSASAPTDWTPDVTLPFTGYNNWKVEFQTSTNIIMPGDSLGVFEVRFTWNENYLPDTQHFEVAGNLGDGGDTAEYPPLPIERSTWGSLKSMFR